MICYSNFSYNSIESHPRMVKNVFIAVITETFNEIRVQFQQVCARLDFMCFVFFSPPYHEEITKR